MSDQLRLNPGDVAPEVSAELLDGGVTTLADLRSGRHLVLHFMREFT